MEIKTLKIKSSHPSQGDFVVINEEDFDASKHVKYGESGKQSEAPDTEPEAEAPKRGRPSKYGSNDVI